MGDVNIRICFPEKSEQERQQLVRQIFIDNGIGLMETMMGWFRKPAYLVDRTTFHGFEQIKEAQAQGRGVMLLGAVRQARQNHQQTQSQPGWPVARVKQFTRWHSFSPDSTNQDTLPHPLQRWKMADHSQRFA